MRELAVRVGVHTTTITSMMFGDRDTGPGIVAAVAAALNVDVRAVTQQVGHVRTEREPYVTPDEVHLLSRRQQVAITELIRAIAEERDGSGRRPAAIAAETVPADAMSDLTAEELERRLRTEASQQPPPESADPGPR